MNLGEILGYMNRSQLSDIVHLSSVAAADNIYTLDAENKATKNFNIETADTVAKSIAIANVPTGTLVQLTVKLKYTNACAITHPTGTVWQNEVIPTFTAGKIYFIQYISDDGGTTWLASCVGAWLIC